MNTMQTNSWQNETFAAMNASNIAPVEVPNTRPVGPAQPVNHFGPDFN